MSIVNEANNCPAFWKYEIAKRVAKSTIESEILTLVEVAEKLFEIFFEKILIMIKISSSTQPLK